MSEEEQQQQVMGIEFHGLERCQQQKKGFQANRTDLIVGSEPISGTKTHEAFRSLRALPDISDSAAQTRNNRPDKPLV